MTRTGRRSLNPVSGTDIVSWVHFGDLHITTSTEANYQDFLALIQEVNDYLHLSVAFAVLPGDNAEDGAAEQYRIIRAATERLAIPIYAIPGDHDRKSGTLDLFKTYLEPDPLQVFCLGRYCFIFLNALDGQAKDEFDIGPDQLAWLQLELNRAQADEKTPVLFMHTYPSELKRSGQRVAELISSHRVLLVEMGHTHYNELANDGRTIYAATRSTGQIEEGPVGFSVTNLDNGVVSWKFKELGEWPFVMITSPAERRLIVDAADDRQVVRKTIPVRARVWGGDRDAAVQFIVGDDKPVPMSPATPAGTWTCGWDSTRLSDGEHRITIRVIPPGAKPAEDTITVLVSQKGTYNVPRFKSSDSENTIGPYPSKGVLGTQLGPNKNGRKW